MAYAIHPFIDTLYIYGEPNQGVSEQRGCTKEGDEAYLPERHCSTFPLSLSPAKEESVMAEGAAFIPFRSIGIVAGPVKASVTGDAQTPTVTTTTGRGWIAWRAHSLVPAIYGNPLGKSIRCLAAWSNITAAACKDGICLYRRAHIIGELEGLPAEPEAVREMVFMGNVLVAYFSDPPSLAVWELQKDEMEGERRGERVSVGAVRSFSLGVSKARGTFLIHPATYLNKVLVGLDDGRAQLWNINSCKLIYEFSFHSPPLAASPSPALDVVAIGLSDGTIAVHNLRYDERIASFRHSPLQNPSPVTCLSFRSGPGQPLLAAGGEDGAISVYDLEASQLHCNLSPAHTGRVVTAEFLPSQPTLLTTGSDNAIQLYSFDLEVSLFTARSLFLPCRSTRREKKRIFFFVNEFSLTDIVRRGEHLGFSSHERVTANR